MWYVGQSSGRKVTVWHSLGKGCPSCKARAIRERYVGFLFAIVFAAEFGSVDVVFTPEWHMCRVSVAKIALATGRSCLSNWKVTD